VATPPSSFPEPRPLAGAKVSTHPCSHTADVHLDDCRVPGSCLLGGKEKLDERLARVREGKRAKSQAAMATFEASRPIVGSQAIGIARAAYEYALGYAKERTQFGRAIIENQSIAFDLANMALEIDAARLLVWRASWMGRNQVPFHNAEGSMSKLKSGQVATWVTERAIQILGGNGYTREFPVERMHRDAKIYDIFEGTSEIQQLVISRAISGFIRERFDDEQAAFRLLGDGAAGRALGPAVLPVTADHQK
jgi:acyl-CoA dehydrogenase